MAEFSKLVITTKGQALLAKMIAGTSGIEFTQISSSSAVYTEEELEGLTFLENIEQTSLVSKVTRQNETAIKVETAFTNAELTEGYYMRALGLYATDPDEGEILYAVTIETSGNCYMPAYNNVTVSGAYVQLVTTVGNADSVTLDVSQAALVTVGEMQELQDQVDSMDELLSDLQGYIGYTDDDIYGVEADFANRVFTRLSASVGKEGGADFDGINAFGGRKRCILADDGTVLAYYGDDAFTTSGALTSSVTIDGTTYAVGTPCQVMVEQPAFYYKVVPMVRDGEHLRKARYYISDKQTNGFKLHPAFIEDGHTNEKIYLSAFEGCIYSGSAYDLTDSVTLATATQKLSSIAGAKPCSGVTNTLYRSATRSLAENRGAGWEQAYAATVAASQILMLVEYATFDMQTAIGRGAVDKTDDGSTNMAENTGATESLGNATGTVENSNGIEIVSYRGEENFWGNIWSWTDGMNIHNPSDWTSTNKGAENVGNLYVADHNFADDTDDFPYEDTGIHPVYSAGSYITAFGYSEKYDWMFVPTELGGDSALPIGDYFYNYSSNWRVAALGGRWNYGSGAGAFYWSFSSSSATRARAVGGRLVYVPTKNVA